MLPYAYLTPQTAERAAEIRRRIRRLQSGGSIDSLRRIGTDTSGQIGASYVSLRELAGKYPQDEHAATLLWGTGQREEQIVACLLFPDTLNKEKITQLADTCRSPEVAEYFGSLFLSRSKELAGIAAEFGDSGIPFRQISSLTGCARHLLLNKREPLISQELFTSLITNKYQEKYVELVAGRYR